MFSGDANFILIGYSFGSLLTLEIANLLEAKGKKGSVKIIDGSPQFLHKLATNAIPDKSDESIKSVIILTCIRLLFPDEFKEIAKKVFVNDTWETQLQAFVEVGETRSQYSAEYGSKMLKALINRVKICLNADTLSLSALKNTSISLIKPTDSSATGFDEDYGLGKYCNGEVKVVVIDGDHASILRNAELLKLLNN